MSVTVCSDKHICGAGDGEKSVVDMRSKSRIGKGDLGANAARITEYFAAVMAQLQ